MFKIQKNIPAPVKSVSRDSRHSMMRGAAAKLRPYESFEVECSDYNDRCATARALYRFKAKEGLKILIGITGEKTFRVWGN